MPGPFVLLVAALVESLLSKLVNHSHPCYNGQAQRVRASIDDVAVLKNDCNRMLD